MGKQDGEMSAAEAAALLGVSAELTVHNYRRRGLLTAREERRGIARRWWYRRDEVEALAERLAQGQAEA